MDGGCSQRRPDFIILCDWGYIVIEVDEFQHERSSYSCECEIARMKQIFFDMGTSKVLFIRFNPDKYKPSYGVEFTLNNRLETLLKIIKEEQDKPIEGSLDVMYLFYDGYTQLELEVDVIDPYK